MSQLPVCSFTVKGQSKTYISYTSKHDKMFLGRARKRTTQLFDQKMLGDKNYLLIANVIVTLFNTRIDIWARQNDFIATRRPL